jgi:hypothetical protein
MPSICIPSANPRSANVIVRCSSAPLGGAARAGATKATQSATRVTASPLRSRVNIQRLSSPALARNSRTADCSTAICSHVSGFCCDRSRAISCSAPRAAEPSAGYPSNRAVPARSCNCLSMDGSAVSSVPAVSASQSASRPASRSGSFAENRAAVASSAAATGVRTRLTFFTQSHLGRTKRGTESVYAYGCYAREGALCR